MAFLLLEVQGHAAFVAVQVEEIRLHPLDVLPLDARIGLGRGLDLDDIGPPIRQHAHAGRPGAGAGQVQDHEVRHRQIVARRGGVQGVCHGYPPDLVDLIFGLRGRRRRESARPGGGPNAAARRLIKSEWSG